MTPELAFEYLIIVTLSIMGLCLLLVLFKTIKGPRVTDRIVTINMTGTLVLSNVFINRYIEEHKTTNIVPIIDEDKKEGDQ